MPYIVQGDSAETRRSNYSNIHHDYNYPHELDLDPKSDFHESIRNKIWQRASESKRIMSKRYSSWNEIDKVLTTYIPLSDVEKNVKEEDSRKPVSIIFPYSYSNLEALLTYMSMAFFQDPMFQYEGVEDDDTIGAMLMELVIRLHCIKTKVPLALHTILRDGFSYGIGPGMPEWTKRYGKVPIRSSIISLDESGEESTQTNVNYVDGLVFEGNSLSSIDPYLWLPDPSVSSDRIQDGEFCGWISRDNYMNMLSEERNSDSMFNVKYLKEKSNKRSSLAKDDSQRETKFGGSSKTMRQNQVSSTNPVDNINMFVTLIPKDWKLSNNEYPEKWFFRLSSDDIITQCYKANHYHGMYPMAVASPEYDGYSITPIGRLEVLKGLQGVLDFMFNSHVENVRKAINDMFVVDPYLVNINDLKDPKAGKLIRLRRPAWGHGVDKVVKQLQVADITRSNVSDSMYITQWMDRISGADQSMSGSLRQGGPERLTKGEFQGTRGSAVSRLQRIAMIIGMQFMQDIGEMFAVHTQQYMTRETFVRITGRNEENLMAQFGKSKVPVSPLDMAINYDLIARDGSVPGSNFSDSWVQLFQIIAGQPELYQQFDVTRIFMYIAQQLGAKNVGDFKRNVDRINPTQMDDEKVLREAEKGNVIPSEEFNG
ncbi:MAG: hypothetical protein DRN30_03590 [Thermoplasmata archaeon]|nr:MAG: hypothetical protein DRN30_03590 [Thermoplasmata archaeon]